MTIAVQSIVQYSLNKQRHTALIVKLAGQQNELAQRLLNEVYSCRFHNCDYAELKLALTKMRQMNSVLQNGDENLEIPELDNEEILANFKKIEPHIAWFETTVGDLSQMDIIGFDELREQVDEFSSIMQVIITQLQKKSEEDIQTMRIIEAELAIFSVLLVLFEIFFIVNPIFKRIISQKKKLTEIAWHQSIVVSSHIKNLKDLDYVLKAEKIPERKDEILSFIQEEIDQLKTASDKMVADLQDYKHDQPKPHELIIGKVDKFLAKYNISSPKQSENKSIRDDKVHSLEP
jgi:hypothetical protein